MFKNILLIINKVSLVRQIMLALLLGIAIALVAPSLASHLTFLGDFFVKALKSIAPILVFFLVVGAISQHKINQETNIKQILVLYLVGTFLAALTAVMASYLFPSTLLLNTAGAELSSTPGSLEAVIQALFLNLADNPVSALANANYIGILAWAVFLGLTLRHSSESTKLVLHDFSGAVSSVVRFVIKFAPLGILGLTVSTLAESSLSEFIKTYAHLLAVLLGCMAFVALVINPLIVFWKIRRNPYPLVFTCLRESGITAFFTRSSAANIPVNMNLCKKLNLQEGTYAISIPLGATINMAGAAVTITVMTLAAVHTLHIEVSLWNALLLSIIASLSACGASGVAGGSLMLIPLACSLFGISNEISAQMIGIGLIIGVLQDSTETALNSSTDALFTATAEYANKK